MLSTYGINDSKIFKIAVVSTMSSGKSTFINALIGREILPSKNMACTAKIIPIFDNDSAKSFRAYLKYKDGEKEIITLEDNNIVDSFNMTNEIEEILIEGNIQGIRNSNRALVLIDTPGTNFSGDDTHQEETYKLIEKLEEGLILYIINATQIGISDDLELMSYIQEKFEKSKKKINILFVVNKIDEFDLQKEDIEKTMTSIKDYIINNGIKDPMLIPISALAAKLFRQAISGQSLTRKELRDFDDYYDLFKSNDYDLGQFAIVNNSEIKHEYINVGEKKIDKKEVLRAIENTGITYVEKEIEKILLNKSRKYKHKVFFDSDISKKQRNNKRIKKEN